MEHTPIVDCGHSSGEVLRHWFRRVGLARRAYEWYLRVVIRRRQRELTTRFGRRVVRSLPGFVFEYDLSENHDVGQFNDLLRGIGYEPETVDLMSRLLRAGHTFVDVGANNGLLSLTGASLVGGIGRVYAFEPNPRSFARLKRNLALNPDLSRALTERPLAIGAQVGIALLYPSPLEDGQTSTVRCETANADSIRVMQSTLDEQLAGVRVDLVKIDVEGSEPDVIQGASETIRMNPHLKLIVEWNPYYATERLWRLLTGHFVLFRIRSLKGATALQPLRSVSDARLLPLCNLLALPISDAKSR